MQRTLGWCSISTLLMLTIFFGYGFDVRAQDTGTIKGKVTGDGNVALANVTVNAYYQENVTGIIVWTHGGQATTDSAGAYTIANLNPGTYHVSFNEYPPVAGYFPEFYNNASTQENATNITLAEGATVNNINAQLSSGAHIKGQVTDLQGNPLSNIRVLAFDANNTAPSDQFADTGADGRYDIGHMAAGSYRLVFEDLREPLLYHTEYYNNQQIVENSNFVTLTTDQTLNNINAQLDRPGFITGKVTDEQNNPLQSILLVAERFNGNLWTKNQYASTNGAGDYILGGLAEGLYRVRFRDVNKQKYSAEYYNNVSDPAAATPLTVTRNTTITNINAQLGLSGGITGKITNTRGEPILGIKVTAEAHIVNFPGEQWEVVQTTQSDMNGDYTLCCMDAGNYRLRFNDPQQIYINEYYNDLYYDAYSSLDDAALVQVTAAMTTTGINAELSPFSKLISRVTDQRNQPLADIVHALYRYNPTEGGFWGRIPPNVEKINDTYQFTLIPGRYRIGLEDGRTPARFKSEFYENALDVNTATDILIGEATTVTINSTLADTTRIMGKVTDSANNPIPNIAVMAYLPSDFPGVPWAPVASSYTDQHGEYSLDSLTPNTYRVGFQDPTNAYHPAFYNNVGYIEIAAPLTLTNDMVVTDINAQLTLNPFTWPPLAQDDRIMVTEGGITSTLSTGSSSLLTNDLAESGGPLQASIVTMPTHGTLNLSPDGTFTYTQNGDEATSDFFTYSVSDGTQTSNVAKVTITIQPINDPPVVRNDSLTVARGQSSATLDTGAKSLLTNDSDPDSAVLTATLKSGPAHGAVSVNANGTFTYTHDGSAGDSDSFTYQATDALGWSAVATVTVAINPFSFSKTVSIAGIKPLCTAVDAMRVPVGTTIVYCYTIHNLGDLPLTSHTLVDSHLGTLLTNHSHTVAAGATFSVTFTQTLTVNTTNIATWTVTSLTGQNVTLAPPSATAKRAATVIIASATDDSDGDGIPDNLEKAGDLDGDNRPNFLDTDADGDGILDKDEVGSNPLQPLDSNQNGIPDYLENVNSGAQQKLFLPIIKR